MESTKKIDKRIEKTIYNIKTALAKLLETKKIDDITVVELTKQAGVNRKTFYLHYSEVRDVFRSIEDNCYDKLRKIVRSYNLQISNLEDFIYTIFNVFLSDDHVFYIMKNTPYSKCFIHMLDKILVETDSPYLSPEPLRGKENLPKNVKYIIEKLANELNLSFDELEDITNKNAKRFYSI